MDPEVTQLGSFPSPVPASPPDFLLAFVSPSASVSDSLRRCRHLPSHVPSVLCQVPWRPRRLISSFYFLSCSPCPRPRSPIRSKRNSGTPHY
ncbi:unnamed protein product, partial [Nesidiocoris tenuis]